MNSTTLFYYSPLTSYDITPAAKESFLKKWNGDGDLAEKDWDALALVCEQQLMDHETDTASVFEMLENGAREHGSHLCAAVLGAAILGTYTRRMVVADGLSWLSRAVHDGVASAAYPLAAWYADRAVWRDLPEFEDVDLGLPTCYDPIPDCPPVPFPKNRAECLHQALFWTLTGLANDIWECEKILPRIDASDELISEFEDLLRKAAKTPLAAKRMLAMHLFRPGSSKKDHEEGIGLLREAAEYGDPHDTFGLSMALKETVGELPDSTAKESFQLCLKAAEGGEPAAMRELSYHYSEGFGTEKNDKLSVKWLCDGAEAGDGECQFLSGIMLLDAATTPKERRNAVSWIRQAAEDNDIPAAWAELAKHYETGDGLYKSKKQANYCRKRAAELGWASSKEDETAAEQS